VVMNLSSSIPPSEGRRGGSGLTQDDPGGGDRAKGPGLRVLAGGLVGIAGSKVEAMDVDDGPHGPDASAWKEQRPNRVTGVPASGREPLVGVGEPSPGGPRGVALPPPGA